MTRLAAVAIHEGAHLVAALRHGVRVKSATIEGERPCVSLADPRASLRDLQSATAAAIALLAGPAADRRFVANGLAAYRLDRVNDLTKAAKLASTMELVRGVRLDLDYAWREAERVVSELAPLVMEAAAWLRGAGTLEGRMLDALATRVAA